MNHLIRWDSPIENIFMEIKEAQRKGCICSIRANELYEEINSLLLELASYLNHNNATSISRLSFQRILKTMNYICIHGIQEQANRYECFKDINIHALFTNGEEEVKQDIELITSLLEDIKATKLPFDNDRYQSIINEQIPNFLKYTQGYNAIFYDCHVEDDLDYPLVDGLSLYHDMYQLQGSDLVLYYIKRFHIEHSFCHHFVHELPELIVQYEALKGVSVEDLGMNLFEMLLNQLVANKALQRDMNLFLMEDEIPIVKEKFLAYGVKRVIQSLIESIDKTFSSAISAYVEEYQSIILQNVERLLAHDYQMLIYEKPVEMKDAIVLNSASNNSIFLVALSNIQNMATLNEKIFYLKEHVHSVYDLIDLLEADIFFDDEYDIYYACLSPQEIAIILKVMQQDLSAFHEIHHLDDSFFRNLETPIVWMEHLKRYLMNLKDKNRIQDIEGALQTLTIIT